MKLRDLLFRTTVNSMLELRVNGKFILKGEAYYFFQNWEDPENNEFNSYVKPYVYEEIEAIKWTDEYLYIYITTEEEE